MQNINFNKYQWKEMGENATKRGKINKNHQKDFFLNMN